MIDVQVLIVVFRRFREIEFVDSEDTHSMELLVRRRKIEESYSRKFRNKNHHQSPAIHRKHPNIIMRIMSTQQKPDTSALSLSNREVRCSGTEGTYSTIGTKVKYFFAGVY